MIALEMKFVVDLAALFRMGSHTGSAADFERQVFLSRLNNLPN